MHFLFPFLLLSQSFYLSQALSQNQEEIQPDAQALSQNQEDIQPDEQALNQSEKPILPIEKQDLSQNEKGKKEILSDKEEELTCKKGPRPYYVTLRHIEGNGIGYNQGYTTLEGFFRHPNPETWVPFLDVRYHFFNNGKPALNAGVGLRYIASSRVWGINGYYDYRKTNHQHYNQIAMGLESLGEIWDFRLNGYLPVGKKISGLFDTRFDGFEGHYLFIRQKYEFSMKGANAEVGAHVNCYKNAPLYFAFGPYYLEGQGKVAWGGEVRAAVDLFGCLRLEASTSYDNVFKWIGQGQVSLTIPFGRKKSIQSKKERCQQQCTLAQRAIQHVDRYEIVPVDRKHKKSAAIDLLTNQPYFFWFVNNTSHSNGTFESPFPTLVQAQNASSPNDVIYVYPGDGTSSGMNAGIVLQDNQKLFGAGIDQMLETTAGTITIPAMASGLPVITASPNSTVTCANNNEVSGLNISNDLFASIECSDIINSYIHNNIINLSSIAVLGIDFQNSQGQIMVTQNQINFLDSAFAFPSGISINSTSTQTTDYLISNNTFNDMGNDDRATGILLQTSTNGTLGPVNVINNQFTGMTQSAITYAGTGTAKLTIIGNNISYSNIPINAGSIFLLNLANGSLNADLETNTWSNTVPTSNPLVFVNNSSPTSTTCLSLLNNIADVNPAYILENSNTSSNSFIANINNNVGTVQETGPGSITSGLCP